jgi:hypothetical protein
VQGVRGTARSPADKAIGQSYRCGGRKVPRRQITWTYC